jgi:hemoglobin
VPTIYEQLGTDAIRAAVDRFYQLVVADPQLAGYFTTVDMAALKRHQAALLVQVTGGPVEYTGRDLAVAHQPLNIPERDFLLVVGHLVATLQELRVEAGVIDQIVDALAAHRDEIVASSSTRA